MRCAFRTGFGRLLAYMCCLTCCRTFCWAFGRGITWVPLGWAGLAGWNGFPRRPASQLADLLSLSSSRDPMPRPHAGALCRSLGETCIVQFQPAISLVGKDWWRFAAPRRSGSHSLRQLIPMPIFPAFERSIQCVRAKQTMANKYLHFVWHLVKSNRLCGIQCVKIR